MGQPSKNGGLDRNMHYAGIWFVENWTSLNSMTSKMVGEVNNLMQMSRPYILRIGERLY